MTTEVAYWPVQTRESSDRSVTRTLGYMAAIALLAAATQPLQAQPPAGSGQANPEMRPWQTPTGRTLTLPQLRPASAAPVSTNQIRVVPLARPPQSAREMLRTYPASMQELLGSASDSDLLGDNDLLGDSADGDLLGGSDLSDEGGLESMGPDSSGSRIPGAGHGLEAPSRGGVPDGLDPHAEAFADSLYPSATKCAKCHQKIYDEWRVSAHAYATVSPMFNVFEQKITELSQGTVGTFCLRCHSPISTQLNYPREASLLDGPLVFREGVTCVACHRVSQPYGRVHGERRIEPGPIQAPVRGSFGGDGVAEAIAEKDKYKIKLDSNSKKPGQEIHFEGIKFEQLSKSGYCQPCHQVAVHPGIALEVVWAQYRDSPACKKGISCQDCHMGLVPGKAQGYEIGPAAVMNGKSVNPNRKHSNHMFFGPGNSIAHPGIFPQNEKALRWTIDQWLEYDWRAGWGTDEFEKAIAQKLIYASFPPTWDTADERRDARKVLDDNFTLLSVKRASSIAVMEAGSRISGPFFTDRLSLKTRRPELGSDLHMNFKIENASEGHNNPSGSLGAQPQLWLNVVLNGPDGEWLWESGYLDANGDLANQHSLQVTQGHIPPDRQLFNLQTQFIITGVKGPDREMYLPVNVDFDQLPFLRPANIPVGVMNHPPFIRMEQKSIPPLGHKMAHYKVPGYLLKKPGTYRVSVRLRSRMEPIYFMQFCGSTPEMDRRMLEQTLDLHPYAVEFTIR